MQPAAFFSASDRSTSELDVRLRRRESQRRRQRSFERVSIDRKKIRVERLLPKTVYSHWRPARDTQDTKHQTPNTKQLTRSRRSAVTLGPSLVTAGLAYMPGGVQSQQRDVLEPRLAGVNYLGLSSATSLRHARASSGASAASRSNRFHWPAAGKPSIPPTSRPRYFHR